MITFLITITFSFIVIVSSDIAKHVTLKLYAIRYNHDAKLLNKHVLLADFLVLPEFGVPFMCLIIAIIMTPFIMMLPHDGPTHNDTIDLIICNLIITIVVTIIQFIFMMYDDDTVDNIINKCIIKQPIKF